jgi:hypothetical protein
MKTAPVLQIYVSGPDRRGIVQAQVSSVPQGTPHARHFPSVEQTSCHLSSHVGRKSFSKQMNVITKQRVFYLESKVEEEEDVTSEGTSDRCTE